MSDKTFYVGIPHLGTVRAETMKSIVALSAAEPRMRGLLDFESCLLPQARNVIVLDFLRTTARYLLFIDSDIVFTPADARLLLDDADPDERPMVSGLYCRNDGVPTWHAWDSAMGVYESAPLGDGLNPLVPLDAAGAGFVLVHRHVFEAMRTAYEPLDSWIWFDFDRVSLLKTWSTRLLGVYAGCRFEKAAGLHGGGATPRRQLGYR